MYPKWRGFCGTLTLAASLALLGCGSTSNTNVRAVNASPNFPNFSFQVGQTGIGSIPYGTEGVQPKGDNYSSIDSSGKYRAVGAGNQTVTAFATPGSGTLATRKQLLASKNYYTIVSVGSAVSLGAPTGMQLDVLSDNGAAPTGGQYDFRFLNASTSTNITGGAIDVYITAVGAAPSGTPVIGGLPFNQLADYMAGSPGALELQVTPAGSTQVLATAPFSPASGSLYSIFFLDPPNTGSSNFSILVVNDPISTSSTK